MQTHIVPRQTIDIQGQVVIIPEFIALTEAAPPTVYVFYCNSEFYFIAYQQHKSGRIYKIGRSFFRNVPSYGKLTTVVIVSGDYMAESFGETPGIKKIQTGFSPAKVACLIETGNLELEDWVLLPGWQQIASLDGRVIKYQANEVLIPTDKNLASKKICELLEYADIKYENSIDMTLSPYYVTNQLLEILAVSKRLKGGMYITFTPYVVGGLNHIYSPREIKIMREIMRTGGKIVVNSHKLKNGDTPLHIAFRNRDLEMIKVLLEAGASVNHANNKGEFPYQEK